LKKYAKFSKNTSNLVINFVFEVKTTIAMIAEAINVCK
jgi:hypothetical protein